MTQYMNIYQSEHVRVNIYSQSVKQHERLVMHMVGLSFKLQNACEHKYGSNSACLKKSPGFIIIYLWNSKFIIFLTSVLCVFFVMFHKFEYIAMIT